MAIIKGTDPSGTDCLYLYSLLENDFVACLVDIGNGFYIKETTIVWEPNSTHLWIVTGNQVLLYLVDTDEFIHVADLGLNINGWTYRELIFE